MSLGRSGKTVAMLVLLVGCAQCSGAGERKRPDTIADTPVAVRPGGGSSEPDDGMVVQNDHGVLDQEQVNRVLDRHVRSLVACYDRAGDAQQFVAGEVHLRFVIAADGAVADVHVMKSNVGNFAVERCLVDESRKVTFPAPGGAKGTDFEYSLQFRSSGERSVVDWDAAVLGDNLTTQSGTLSACGRVAEQDVTAVAYVEPGGVVASVGLASEGPIDAIAAVCVVEQIRRWHLPCDSTHVVRTQFPVIASAEPAVPLRKDIRRPKRPGRRVDR